MQFSFLSLGAFALLASSVAAGGIHLGGKRATLADDCKRSYSALPSVSLQTTAVSPQPTQTGAGSGGYGGKNGTTPVIPNEAAESTGTSTSTSGAGVVDIEWTMGVLAAAGAVVMAI